MDQLQRRAQLQTKLETLLGSRYVYYQQPSTIQGYPCIIYTLDDIILSKADNRVYQDERCYSVTFISQKPIPKDSEGKDFINKFLYTFEKISFNRPYVSDNLWHFVFKLYY